LRRTEALRGLVRETRVSAAGLIYPMFACPGNKVRVEVSSMPGVYQQSPDQIVEECREVADLGVPAVILFGLPEKKDETGSEAASPTGAVQRSIEAIRKAKLNLVVITDVCLCEYTSHGHCGVIKDGEVLNDPSIALLADAALSHVRAGADIVAPSDMMDGRVAAIREKLDANKFTDIAILAYAAKYSSAFYGPFREAVGSAKQLGAAGKHTYQMDPANSDEALREVALDIAEGADMVMIKPGLPYLDIVRRVKDRFGMPTFVYQVSGEYAMIMAAAANGWIDERAVALETLVSIKRAGADGVLTYFAKRAAEWLEQ
jgi:porphobilinogen synthase